MKQVFKNMFFMITLTLFFLLSFQLVLSHEPVDILRSIDDIELTINNNQCILGLSFRDSNCVVLGPGYWTQRICRGRPQSFPDEKVISLLSTIRAQSEHFSELYSIDDACSILRWNVFSYNRARRMYLTNLFNYAEGLVSLDEPVNSQYHPSNNLREVFEFTEYLFREQQNYKLIGDLHEDIHEGNAISCVKELEDSSVSCSNDISSLFKRSKNYANTVYEGKFTKFFIPFRAHTFSDSAVIVSDDSFIINDFKLSVSGFSKSSESGNLKRYKSLFEDNEIVHSCYESCQCTTTIRANLDCYSFANELTHKAWYYSEGRAPPRNMIYRTVYEMMKWSLNNLIISNTFEESVEIVLTDGSSTKYSVFLSLDEELLTKLQDETPWKLPSGLYNGVVSVNGVSKNVRVTISN